MPGSGIGSFVVGWVSAAAYIHTTSKTPEKKLNINLFHASKPVAIFVQHFVVWREDSPFCVINVDPQTYGAGAVELFYTDVVMRNNLLYHKCDADNFYYDYFDRVVWQLREPHRYKTWPESIDVCINVRRGDKVTCEPHLSVVSVAKYVQEIENTHTIHTGSLIYHTADDYDTFEELRTLRPEWNVATICKETDRGFVLLDMNAATDEYVIEHVATFLKALAVMKHATYFIGTGSTNVGFMAKLLRHGRDMVLL